MVLMRGSVFAVICSSALSLLTGQTLEVRTLSGRPDMVTGGEVLVEIRSSRGSRLDSLTVTLNGTDVTRQFRPQRTGSSLTGRVAGLKTGENTLRVRAGKEKAQFDLIGYPITGPVFAGPKQSPFICQTEASGLGPPRDADCSIDTKVSYYYKSTDPLPSARPAVPPPPGSPPWGFKRFEPLRPHPPDLAKTTITTGQTVDYIVRSEKGTINRAIYEIAFLHQPGQPLPDPWTGPMPGWNGRLVYVFIGGCAVGYRQGILNSTAIPPALLADGYAVATSTLNVFGNNCDDVISAETMMMVKEHFIKQFGPPVHTIGYGSSGGSIQQHLIAQNYPGLLDAINPVRSFPDQISGLGSITDCSLLLNFFDHSTLPWTQEQKTDVSGFADFNVCAPGKWLTFTPGLLQPDACDRSIPRDLIYNARNPKGTRCTIFDNQVNVYGRNPQTGFARRTLDNIGVQYGLLAFNAGKISAAQFLELNEKIGGFDADGRTVTARSVADPAALPIAYETGRVNSGAGSLSSIPILDVRAYLDPDIHDKIRSDQTRARLEAANRTAANQVMFTTSRRPPVAGGNTIPNATRLLDQWLDNIAADESPGSTELRLSRNRPVAATDTCWAPDGQRIVEPHARNAPGRCDQLYPAYGDPRIAAGAPIAGDILKCNLRPVDPSDYVYPLTPDQVLKLKRVFPDGVCDYGQPGVGQQKIKQTWLMYPQ
jgi:hypothetical protein